MAEPDPGPNPDERLEQVRQVVEECMERRAAGETLTDQAVIAVHPDLLPELAEELRNLAAIEQARKQVGSGVNRRAARAESDGEDSKEEMPGPSTASPGLEGLFADDSTRLPHSDSIPGYEIIREIHRGGQGVVYQAIQKATKRKVAIKIMREGPFAGARDKARFEREVQILAGLNHSNIVTIHDSGVATGNFYFVMDYISGQPLDAWITSGQHSIEETLRLFATICSAVNAAHLRGVIHRDLKPSNIRMDPEGQPQILDFGLAKVAAGQMTDETRPQAMTVTGQFIGSLPWASPEQAEGSPSKIDIRTDVYSLGVILYQMLTGKFPYDVIGNMRDVLERILKAEPARPSTIRRQINDEVETIVLKCLAKERDRRYQSAGELARDIQHYLAGEPVEAKRDSALYVLRKTLRRYRLAAGTIGTFVLLIAFSSVAFSVLYYRAERARGEADVQRKVAETAKIDAERRQKETQQVADFQEKMLSEIDVEAMGRGIVQRLREQVRAGLERETVGEWPNRRPRTPEEVAAGLRQLEEAVAPGHPVDVARRVMDEYFLRRAAEAAREQFANQPLVLAQLSLAIARIYESLGLYDAAVPLSRAALDLRRGQLGNVHPLVATSLNNLGILLHKKDDYSAAESMLRESLELHRKLFGPKHLEVAGVLTYLALVLQDTAQYAAAEEMHRAALAMYRELLGKEHPLVATGLNNLALLLQAKNEYAAAEPLFLEALAMRRKLLGDQDPLVASTLLDLGTLYYARGDYPSADRFLRDALERTVKAYGHEHPKVANLMNTLGVLLYVQQDYDAAERLFREALDINRKLLGNNHSAVASNLADLGSVLKMKGDYAGAEPLFRQALAIDRVVWGDQHPHVAASLDSLANLLIAKKEYAPAEPILREALAILRAVYPGPHGDVAMVLSNLAEVMDHQGDPSTAEKFYREALAIRRQVLGEKHPDVALNLNALGQLLASEKNYAGAEEAYVEGLRICAEPFPQAAQFRAVLLHHRAAALWAQGQKDRALPMAREALQMFRDHPGWPASEAHHAFQIVTDILYFSGNGPELSSELGSDLERVRKTLPPVDARLGGLLAQYGKLLLDLKSYADAEPLLRESLEIRRQLFPDGHPQAWSKYNAMSMLGEAMMGTAGTPPATQPEPAVSQTRPADRDRSAGSQVPATAPAGDQHARLLEAEQLLLDGYKGMKDDLHVPSPAQAGGADRRREAIERITRFYEWRDRVEPGSGFDTRAAQWRQNLAAYTASTRPSSRGS